MANKDVFELNQDVYALMDNPRYVDLAEVVEKRIGLEYGLQNNCTKYEDGKKIELTLPDGIQLKAVKHKWGKVCIRYNDSKSDVDQEFSNMSEVDEFLNQYKLDSGVCKFNYVRKNSNDQHEVKLPIPPHTTYTFKKDELFASKEDATPPSKNVRKRKRSPETHNAPEQAFQEIKSEAQKVVCAMNELMEQLMRSSGAETGHWEVRHD